MPRESEMIYQSGSSLSLICRGMAKRSHY